MALKATAVPVAAGIRRGGMVTSIVIEYFPDAHERARSGTPVAGRPCDGEPNDCPPAATCVTATDGRASGN